MESCQCACQIGKDACHDEHLEYGKQPEPSDGVPRESHAQFVEEPDELCMYPGMVIAHRQLADDLAVLVQTVHGHDTGIVGQKIGQPGKQTEEKADDGQFFIVPKAYFFRGQ